MKQITRNVTVLILLSYLLSLASCSGDEPVVEVKPSKAGLVKIEIASLPAKTTYTLGESLSLNGLVVEGLYSDNSKAKVTVTEENIKGFSSDKSAEELLLTITVEKLTATFPVKVLPLKIEKGVLTYVEPAVTTLILPDYVKSIGEYVFRSSNISEVTLNEGLISIGEQAFAWSRIAKINFPASLTKIDAAAFYGCEKITVLDLSKTSLSKITHETFVQNTGLETVKLPATVREIEFQAFLDATSLKELILPEGLLKIGNEAFRESGLVNLKLPNSICYMDQRAFYLSGELQTVETFGSAPAADPGIGICKMESSTFERCPNLTHFEIPQGVQIIGQNTIAGSPRLDVITLPATVKEIAFNAFANTGLKTVNVEGIVPAIAGTISGAWQAFPYNIVSIKVPAGSAAAYKAALGWKDYANAITE